MKGVEGGVIPIDRASKLDESETFRRHLIFKMRANHIPKDWLNSRVDSIDDSTRNEFRETFRTLVKLGIMEEEKDGLTLSTAGRVLNHETASLFSSDNVINTALERETGKESRYSSFIEPNTISKYKCFIKKHK